MRTAALLCLCLALAAPLGAGETGRELLDWTDLPALPDPLGFGGPFAGISNGALVVAGGAHFPTSLFEGGTKKWVDSVFVLPEAAKEWVTGRKLAHPLAYGVSITTGDGILLIGGCDDKTCFADVILMWLNPRSRKLEFEELPPLIKPRAFFCGAKVGDVVYVAGGIDTPGGEPKRNFWALDLSAEEPAWKALPPWPGPARQKAVAASQAGAFYLFSGTGTEPGADGKPKTTFLTDAYRYDPKKAEWTPLAPLPFATAAAPTPAATVGQSHILLFGGSDGSRADQTFVLKDKHPGFRREILAYHTITDTWTPMGEVPLAFVTTTLVQRDDEIIVASGEVRPGVRSPRVLRAVPKKHEASFGRANWMVLRVYIIVLVGMGIYFSRREKTTDDFFLAGRRVPWWAAGLSIYGTQLSAITFMAIPALIYATNWLPFFANMTIVMIAPLIVFVYLPFYRRLNVTTAYEYLERRFSLSVRMLGSLVFLFYQLCRMGIVLLLPAIALSAATGIDVRVCILLMGVLCTIYTVLGGIEAVIWTDVLQVVVLLGGAWVALFVIAGKVDGGFGGIFEIARADAKLTMFHWSWDYTAMAFWVVVIGNFFGNLVPYTTDQAVIQRYLTTKDERAAARGIWTNAVLVIPGSLLFFCVGTALYAYFKTHAAQLEPTLAQDAIFPLFIVQSLPAGVAGLVIAGVFAASMSSLDSSMNSMATALVTDFYRRFRPDAPDSRCLRLARILTLVLGILGTGTALVLAPLNIMSLWLTFAKMLGLVGGGLAGMFALGVFTRRATAAGALTGFVAGSAVTLGAWRFTPVHGYLYAPIGVLTCVVVGYAVSVLSPSEPRELDGLTLYTMGKAEE
jgi:SSS family transporter